MAAPIVYLDPNVMSGILLYGFAGALSMEALGSCLFTLSTTMPSKYLHFIRAEELTPPLPTFACHHGPYCAQANASSPRTKGSPRLAKS